MRSYPRHESDFDILNGCSKRMLDRFTEDGSIGQVDIKSKMVALDKKLNLIRHVLYDIGAMNADMRTEIAEESFKLNQEVERCNLEKIEKLFKESKFKDQRVVDFVQAFRAKYFDDSDELMASLNFFKIERYSSEFYLIFANDLFTMKINIPFIGRNEDNEQYASCSATNDECILTEAENIISMKDRFNKTVLNNEFSVYFHGMNVFKYLVMSAQLTYYPTKIKSILKKKIHEFDSYIQGEIAEIKVENDL